MGGEWAPGRGGAPRGGPHCPCDVRFGCRSHARTYPFQRPLVLIFMTACLRPSGLYCRPPESDLEGVRRRPSSPCAVTPHSPGGRGVSRSGAMRLAGGFGAAGHGPCFPALSHGRTHFPHLGFCSGTSGVRVGRSWQSAGRGTCCAGCVTCGKEPRWGQWGWVLEGVPRGLSGSRDRVAWTGTVALGVCDTPSPCSGQVLFGCLRDRA